MFVNDELIQICAKKTGELGNKKLIGNVFTVKGKFFFMPVIENIMF